MEPGLQTSISTPTGRWSFLEFYGTPERREVGMAGDDDVVRMMMVLTALVQDGVSRDGDQRATGLQRIGQFHNRHHRPNRTCFCVLDWAQSAPHLCAPGRLGSPAGLGWEQMMRKRRERGAKQARPTRHIDRWYSKCKLPEETASAFCFPCEPCKPCFGVNAGTATVSCSRRPAKAP